uniref:Protein kinase domain-containing protein n=1 Tax=Calcidiscus leptoporus TaxID=127549 RepID=A0A7S0JKV0_9EUKA
MGVSPTPPPPPCRSVDCYEKLYKIDEGAYGVVYKAKDRITGEIVALKQVKLLSKQEGFPVTSLREINVLLSLSHPNVVKVREMVVGNTMDKIFMAMDFMDHDLKGLMQTMKQPFSASEVKRLMIDLMQALEYCHEHWVLHRDLKTSNLLMSSRGVVSLCDFGLARMYGEPLKNYTELVVTLWYRAPELLLGCKLYGPEIDVWSMGCIFAELVLREPLLPGKGELDQIDKIFKLLGTPTEASWPGVTELPNMNKVQFRPQPFNHLRNKFKRGASFTSETALSDAGLDLLNSMLSLDPKKRITAKQALEHEYFLEQPPPKAHHMMPTYPSSHDKKGKQKVRSVNEEEAAQRMLFHSQR